ncbi:MAG: hypothetical protein ACFFEJ_18120 [Candidatus Thorarchaeota archaeon]
MKDDQFLKTIKDIKEKVDSLMVRFRNFSYASEEFWAVHDEIVQLLYKGLDLANAIEEVGYAREFREKLNILKDSVPSGYWK